MTDAIPVSEHCTELIPSVSLENLLRQREAILTRYDAIRTIALELKGLFAGFHQSYPPDIEWEHHGRYFDFVSRYQDNPDAQRKRFTQAIDQMAWDHLMKA